MIATSANNKSAVASAPEALAIPSVASVKASKVVIVVAALLLSISDPILKVLSALVEIRAIPLNFDATSISCKVSPIRAAS